ncbi:integrase catalytic subunit [Intrasporangium calvum DSM] [Mycobacterium shimoidei]|uniref:Integrase catalytic subunit [Intrasporangium calvum DSM] n=1 Tax=Mycobacterium shimoidei TaxID=29313 RepID=A0A375YWA7_MYCSH|nr:IS21 family transposase [Mycobacterium shimoidei]SRX93127.1 integrase catalytic subunit [Intrasporangium calvum DSM] [Mycobacterium shimoidei]SRX94091.1 integrase catalytic subunit [Intrasporangium calvum DSM] [Mycobacterium shimoidei]
MLTWEDDVEVHALRRRGWSISAIARHTGFDRKTVRKYLNGDAEPGVRARPSPDPFEPFVDYVTARLTEDPHLWARTLFDELEELGFALSYQSLTRNIRQRDLRPVCEACRTATERPNTVIPHPPGHETQWDWLELPNPPGSWGWGKTAQLLVGSLAHSGKWRAALSPSQDQPHLVAALDRVTRALGGVTRVWRFDRMTTVCDPGSGRVTASFAGVAKHYGVSVAVCPARRGNRKGVVEKVNHTAAQRWWRTLADETTVEAAQASVDRFARMRGDTRLRSTADGRSSVATVAAGEPLQPVPAMPYPVIICEQRTASRQALVSYRGNRYSVPPELAAAQVVVSHPVGGEFVDIATTTGIVIARHHLAADGLGVMVRDSGHVIALDAAAMATAATGRPHRRKERIPPGPAAKAAAAHLLRLKAANTADAETSTPSTDSSVVDLSAYERAAQNRTVK